MVTVFTPAQVKPGRPADAVAQGLAARLDQVKHALGRVDDDGAGLFLAVIVDDLPDVARIGRVAHGIGIGCVGLALGCGGLRAAREQELDQAAAETRRGGIGAGRDDRGACHERESPGARMRV